VPSGYILKTWSGKVKNVLQKARFFLYKSRAILIRSVQMPLFVWKDNYSVEIKQLDDHHKNLFRIFNVLYENTVHSTEVENVLPIICELQEYTKYHFLTEEQHMQDIDFPGTDEHIARHRDFAHQITGLNSRSRDELEMTKELIVVLGNWLLHHVLEEDHKYLKWQKDKTI
jgi:hemerythrin-like metal-binding protein